MNVVVSCFPLKLIVEVSRNPLPSTLRVKAGVPTSALAGERLAMFGTGLLIGNATAFDVPPPGLGFVTVTL